MPRINLLPLRQKRRRGTAQREIVVLVGALGGVLLLLFVWYTAGESEIADKQARLDQVNVNIGQLEKDVAKVKDLEQKTKAVEQKRGVIDQLQKSRIGPARMLDDLAVIFTQEKKTWLTSLVEINGKLELRGLAMEHENVSDLQTALERRSKFLRNVVLDSVKVNSDKGTRTLEWLIRCETNYAAGG